jgi:hypothetical protein
MNIIYPYCSISKQTIIDIILAVKKIALLFAIYYHDGKAEKKLPRFTRVSQSSHSIYLVLIGILIGIVCHGG